MGNALGGVSSPASRGASALRTFARASHDVSRSISNLGRSIFSWRTLFLGYFAGNMMGNAKKALIDYNAELDNFRQGIALSLNQMTDWGRSFGGVSDHQERWNKSMMGASSIMGILRKQAASSIGSTKEYMEGFQMLNSAIQAVGGSAGDTIEVVKRLIPLAKASGRDVMTGVMDITQILRGDTNLRQVNLPVFRDPRVLELAKMAKGVPKQGIQGDQYGAMKGLIDVMSKADPAIKSYAQTFNAQLETAIDNIQMFSAEIGKPIFNKITAELKIFNKDWGSTQMRLQATGEKIGKFLIEKFDQAKGKIGDVVEMMKKLGAQLSVVAAGLVGIRVAGAAAGLLSFAGTGAARNNIGGIISQKASKIRSKLSDPFGMSDLGNIDGSGINLGKMNGVKQASTQQYNQNAQPMQSSSGGQVGFLRGAIGTAGAAFLGLGIAMNIVSEQAEKLAKQNGYAGEMAKKARDAMNGIKDVLESIANAAVITVGYLARLGESIGELAAKAAMSMSNLNQPRNYTSFDTSARMKSSEDVVKLTETYNSQMKWEKEQRQRLLGLSNDPLIQEFVKEEMKSSSSTNDPIGSLIGKKGGLDRAFRRGSGRKSIIDVGGKKSVVYKDSGGIPLDQNIIASELAGDNSAEVSVRAEYATRKINLELSKRRKRLEDAIQKIDRKFADEFLGQKQKKEQKFDFSGSTFHINQDYRNVDPDGVAVQFVNDLGQISATSLQSRLAPIMD